MSEPLGDVERAGIAAGVEREASGLVSVVIPAHNVADIIGQQLEALARQSYADDFEVVVVDNRSSDDLAAALRPFEDSLDVRLVPAPDRAGVSHARNVGCRAARGALIAICDADDEVETTWLANMVAASGQADMLGGRLDDRKLNTAEVRRWRMLSPGLKSPLNFLPFAVGANFALWRDVFDMVGGWDETFVGGGDDVDFAWRAQLKGLTLGYAEDAVVHYRLRNRAFDTMRQISAYEASGASLLTRYRSHGARAGTARQLAADVAWIFTRSPFLLMLGSWRQGRWLVKVASLWGRAKGSVLYRVWAF